MNDAPLTIGDVLRRSTDHLVGKGIDAARLEAKGLGATKPVAPNTTAEGRQQNRRVELVKR